MKEINKIILTGPAASGKDHLRDYLNGILDLDVSYTTRPKRDGEKDGYTYNYITEESFDAKVKDNFFYENIEFNRWKYGTSKENWNISELFIMTPSGIKCIKPSERESCFVVYFNISDEIRRERLSKRSDSDTTERRIIADNDDFLGFGDYDYMVTESDYEAKALFSEILKQIIETK